MRSTRPELMTSIVDLTASAQIDDRCIGHNYYIEENVDDVRQAQFDVSDPSSDNIRAVADAYFRGSVQGVARGHRSSTFDEAVNRTALLSATVEANQKIVRLERIDKILAKDPALTFDRLQDAHGRKDTDTLRYFADLFRQYPGERPAFAAFKSEVDADLRSPDWLPRLIDRIGLYHHYRYEAASTYAFALMEYTAAEVMTQASNAGISRPFALATVLECQDNPAFFPVPRGASHGFTVDLRNSNPSAPRVKEILHIRFDYAARHVSRLASWSRTDAPDIESSRVRHLAGLRRDTGRADFGEWPA